MMAQLSQRSNGKGKPASHVGSDRKRRTIDDENEEPEDNRSEADAGNSDAGFDDGNDDDGCNDNDDDDDGSSLDIILSFELEGIREPPRKSRPSLLTS